MSDRIYQNAAMDAHFVVLHNLQANLGRKPTEFDVAQSLAMALGDALGLVIVRGAETPKAQQHLDMVSARCEQMIANILTDDCVGSA